MRALYLPLEGQGYRIWLVMRALVARIHVLLCGTAASKTWMAGTRGSQPRKRGGVPDPAMTHMR